MTKEDRLLNIKNGYNYRDIGGYPTKDGRITKWHKIVRAGNLAYLNPDDEKQLLNYGINCDIDLRSSQEEKNEPDIVPKGIQYEFNPVFDDEQDNSLPTLQKRLSNDPNYGKRHLENVYHNIIIDHHARDAYRHLFQRFLKQGNNNGILFHCSQGKDRTGMAVVMLLLTLGVDEETVKKDYLFSKQQMVPYVKNKLKYFNQFNINDNFRANIKSLYTVDESYYQSAIDTIHQEYGSINNFIHKYLNLNDKDINKLRDIYLDNPK